MIFAFAACKNEPKTTATPETTPTVTNNAVEVGEKVKSKKTPTDAPAFAPLNLRSTVAEHSPVIGAPGAPVSPQTQSLLEALNTDYWLIAFYVRMAADPEVRTKLAQENQKRWFDFSLDGTFISGKGQETTGKGRYYYDPMGPMMYLDHDDRRDEEFTVKMNSDKTVMIWVGTETFKETGVQVKVENSSDLPK